MNTRKTPPDGLNPAAEAVHRLETIQGTAGRLAKALAKLQEPRDGENGDAWTALEASRLLIRLDKLAGELDRLAGQLPQPGLYS